MTDMTQSTELQAFIRQKDGYKVAVKISLFICVVLSWDELKVWQNLLDSDYEIYMERLLVTTINWHKSLQFAKRSNITLLQLCGGVTGLKNDFKRIIIFKINNVLKYC